MKTFKTQIYMNNSTKDFCRRAFGVRRKIWNWALAESLSVKKETNRLPTNYDLMKVWREKIAAQADKHFVWLTEQMVSTRVAEETMKDIVAAFALARTQSKKKHKKGIKPHFKSRKNRSQTFSYYRANASAFRIESSHIFTFSACKGKTRGEVRTRESLDFLRHDNVKLCRMTITCKAGKYYLCISYEKPNQDVQSKAPASSKIGIDLGIVISAVSFDGQNYVETSFNSKASLKSDRLAKRNDKELSRKIYGSKRYEKELLLKQRRALKAINQRNALLEEYTTELVHNYSEIVIDDFNFKSVLGLKTVKRDKAYRCMIYQFKLRLEQKAADAGVVVRYVEHRKGQKTTHKCAHCSSTAVLIDKNTRILSCRTCGFVADRDRNAAINTFNL